MKITNILFSNSPISKYQDHILLILRIVVGLAFILHGLPKIQAPFSWMGPNSFAPGIFLGLAALSEFGGGIALILGLMTKLASLGLAFTMLVAVYFHAIIKGDSFVGKPGEGSYELALVYLLISILFIIYGAGKYSLDNKINSKNK
jgi:putative oxidoreductase